MRLIEKLLELLMVTFLLTKIISILIYLKKLMNLILIKGVFYSGENIFLAITL